MKELVVISGKGGTGKTSIVGSLAALSPGAVLADCDVDAANLHLLLDAQLRETEPFRASQVAVIREEDCLRCGLCAQLCRFDAIRDYKVDPIACEGCQVCYHICPTETISMQEVVSGHCLISHTPYGQLVHGRLGIGQANSGKLVTLVRERARELAEAQGSQYILTDGPPGIGCPVISSLSGAAAALIVTEPTWSGIHDLERVLAVCRHFGVPALVCINRYDLSLENTRRIEEYCHQQGIEVVGKIAVDPVVVKAMVAGRPVVAYEGYEDGLVSRQIKDMWARIRPLLLAS